MGGFFSSELCSSKTGCKKKTKILKNTWIKYKFDWKTRDLKVKWISPKGFLERFEAVKPGQEADFCVLDVRNPHEIEKVSLNLKNEQGAEIQQLRVPLPKIRTEKEILELVQKLPKEKEIFVFCYYGVRSAKACIKIRDFEGINPINVDFGFAGLNKLDPERYPLY